MSNRNRASQATARKGPQTATRRQTPVVPAKAETSASEGTFSAQWLLELYDRVADAPGAVERLRKFVLDLAVRGKLVEQNPTDEPASVLLDRIATARSLAPKSGRGKAKNIEDPTLTQIDYSLPNGWEVANLEELVRVVNGRAYKKAELLEEGTPVLRVGNLFTSKHWYYSDLELEEDKYCEEGDLIYAWSASFGPFIWNGPRAIYHYHIWKLPLFSEADLSKQFLYLFLQQKTEQIKDAGHGVSMVHMTKAKMEQLAVPVPPLAEQHRIVAKVNDLMALLDRLNTTRTQRETTRNRLTTASLAHLTAPETTEADFPTYARFALDNLDQLTSRPELIKVLRQTMLNLAVRGKLVEQDPGDEPASELLKRIEAKKAQLEKEGVVKKGKRLASLTNADSAYDLPNGWTWTRLNELAQVGTGLTPSKSQSNYYQGGTIPWINSSATGQVVIKEAKHFVTPLAVSECRLKIYSSGSLVVALYGQGKTRGQVAELGLNATVNQACAVVEWFPSLTEMKDYIRIVLEQQYEAMRDTADGGPQPNLNLGKVKSRIIPLPPLAEQRRIVAKVHSLMACCDLLEVAIVTAEASRSQLLETLLHEALPEKCKPGSPSEMPEKIDSRCGGVPP